MADDPQAADDPRAWIRVLVARYKDRLQAAEDDGAQEAESAYREVVEDLEDLLGGKPPPRLPRRVLISLGAIDAACEVMGIAQDVILLRPLEPSRDLADQTHQFAIATGERLPTDGGASWRIHPVDLAVLQEAARGKTP